MNLSTRKQKANEERQRVAELEEYFASRKWDWRWKTEVNVQTRKTRKMFKDEQFQLMRPTLRQEA